MILSLNLSSKNLFNKGYLILNGKDQLSVVPPVMIKFEEFNSLSKFFWFFSDPTDQKK